LWQGESGDHLGGEGVWAPVEVVIKIAAKHTSKKRVSLNTEILGI
jgi:hypothetical protein